MNIGMLVANLPACRPLLEGIIQRFSSWTGSGSRSFGGGKKSHGRGTSLAGTNPVSKQYLELGERPESTTLQNYLSSGHKKSRTGVETRIYGDLDRDIDGFRVNVHKDFKVEVTRSGKALPRTPIPGDLV
jgi:hypothetical protein